MKTIPNFKPNLFGKICFVLLCIIMYLFQLKIESYLRVKHFGKVFELIFGLILHFSLLVVSAYFLAQIIYSVLKYYQNKHNL